MTILDVKLRLSDHLLERLEEEAHDLNLPLDQVVMLAVEDFLEDESDEDILAGIRQGMLEALAGNTMPAKQAIAEIRRELGL